MRSTGKDETGAGDDSFGFFDRVDLGLEELKEKRDKFKVKWEDPFFRVTLKIIGTAFLIGVCVNILIGLAKWWWL